MAHIALANGASAPKECADPIVLDYRPSVACSRRINISLPDFVRSVYNLDDRVLDLLELAAYVFAVDRIISRGRIDAVEYHSWSRSIHLIIRVRDYAFWETAEVQQSLSRLLEFLTGDREFSISFQPGHRTPPTGLFDHNKFQVDIDKDGAELALFSGGVDSLAGAIELLEHTPGKVILASHQASTSSIQTQRGLITALKSLYPNRVVHYPFQCNLKDIRATDETQRSRSFLFSCIAYALASAYGLPNFHFFENGITSMNLHRREDLMNSRASRTTHPKTIACLSSLFSLISHHHFFVLHPFLFKTKSEVMKIVADHHPELLSSTVSCTRTAFAKGSTTHCGTCFQCVDRRIAAFGAGVQDIDHPGLYKFNIVADPLEGEAKTVALDYIRQAHAMWQSNADGFYNDYLLDISQIAESLQISGSDFDKAEALWALYHRHGVIVKQALTSFRTYHDDIFSAPPVAGSLLDLISKREHLKPDTMLCVDALSSVLIQGVGDMFASHPPISEHDLNEKVGALLRSHDDKFRSEYPTVSFAGAHVIPDHQNIHADILIEAKYIRKNTPPSVATEGIAADLTKYPKNSFIIFVVYDPGRKIKSDVVFRSEIEVHQRNRVLIIR